MKLIYRLVLGMTFDTKTDRDSWVTKFQSSWSNLKTSMPPPTKTVITPDEYVEVERLSDIQLS